eukprot:158370-Ditylum_brightwellii.AAC.1
MLLVNITQLTSAQNIIRGALKPKNDVDSARYHHDLEEERVMDWTHESMVSWRIKNCNCKSHDKNLCLPVQKKHVREIFGFGNGQGNIVLPLNYSLITTVAWWNGHNGIDEMCNAHAHNSRAITNDAPIDTNGKSHPVNLELLGSMVDDPSLRTEWVKIAVNHIITNFYDGLTFDFESPLSVNDPRNDAYVMLVKETNKALKDIDEGFQISVCASWGPGLPLGIDGRAYDYKALADASDYLYVMQYDTRSQIFYDCTAAPNCPLSISKLGIEQYLALGIAPEKIIMGVPWYGYSYGCVDEGGGELLKCSEENNQIQTCHLKLVPFRGVECSDAAGSQI